MRRITMRTTVAIGSIAVLLAVAAFAASPQPPYRDLNHNGRMDPYENPRLAPEARADHLLARMTPEETVGVMLHGTLPAVDNPIGASSKGYDSAAVERLIVNSHVNSFITRLSMPPAVFAEQNNRVRRIAERSRLGTSSERTERRQILMVAVNAVRRSL